MNTTVPATPTLPPAGSVVYVPVIVEGRPIEPTAVATRASGPVPVRVPSDALTVTSALTTQRAGASGLVLEVEGEIRNDSAIRVQGIRIIVEAKGSGESCGRGALTLLGKTEAVLAPGDVWPFTGVIHLECSAQEVAFEPTGVETNVSPLLLGVEGAAVGLSATGDWVLSGSLRNSTGLTVAYPRVVVTLRGVGGVYLASGLAYAGVAKLAPGEVTPFQVVVSAARATGWASFTAIGTGERG
ncbi:MAG: FxLYD domain-containing protein [Anaerolineae bacterium]